MKAIYARLDKLEAALPPPTLLNIAPDPTAIHSLEKKILELKFESARVEALQPKEKIAYIRAKISEQIAKAEAPPLRATKTVDLSAQLHAIAKKIVSGGFHAEHHEIRRCELILLREHGYDSGQLEVRHRQFDDLPWQWVPENEMLPDDAQHLIDRILSA